MTTAKEIRLRRARALAERTGGIQAFADRVGMSVSQASQIIGVHPVRFIGDAQARRIEGAFALPVGYLDREAEVAQVEALPIAAPLAADKGGTATTPFNAMVFADPHASSKDFRTLAVFGDAMAPTIASGDLVVVDTSRHARESDGIAVVEWGGRAYVRRVTHSVGGSVSLTADNPAIPPQVITGRDRAAVAVLGRVVYVVKVAPV